MGRLLENGGGYGQRAVGFCSFVTEYHLPRQTLSIHFFFGLCAVIVIFVIFLINIPCVILAHPELHEHFIATWFLFSPEMALIRTSTQFVEFPPPAHRPLNSSLSTRLYTRSTARPQFSHICLPYEGVGGRSDSGVPVHWRTSLRK